MARIRSVHPGLWTDEQFVEISDKAKLLFIAIGSEADDRGVFVWKPISLKMRLRAWDGERVDPLLQEMENVGLITKFEVDGRHYGAIKNFCKWQRPKSPQHIHPCPDTICEFVRFEIEGESPSRGTALARMLCERQNGSCHYCAEAITFYRKKLTSLEIDHKTPVSRNGEDVIENLVAACKPCNSLKGAMTEDEFRAAHTQSDMVANCRFRRGESANIIPFAGASQVRKTHSGEKSPQMEDGGDKRKGEKKESPHRPPGGGRVDEEFFVSFWTAYPKRDGANPRKPARDRFRSACKSGADPDAIVAGAVSYRRHCEAKGIVSTPYVAQATTWLNQQRWLDEYDAAPSSPNGRKSTEAEELLRQHLVTEEQLAEIRKGQHGQH
jgi:hypothetical protein